MADAEVRARLENAAAAALTTYILKKQTPQQAVVDAILAEQATMAREAAARCEGTQRIPHEGKVS